jgi:hypothetical protein
MNTVAVTLCSTSTTSSLAAAVKCRLQLPFPPPRLLKVATSFGVWSDEENMKHDGKYS